jgi:NADH-quinone oxidoreductase subunit L
MIFVTFFGEVKIEPTRKPENLMVVPMVTLAVLSLIGGFIELPENFGPVHLFSKFVNNVLPVTTLRHESVLEFQFQLLSAIISLLGVFVAYLLFFKKNAFEKVLSHSRLGNFLSSGWGFDWLYDRLFVWPVVWLSQIDKKDFIYLWNKGLAYLVNRLNDMLSFTQNGKLRWYAMALAIGIVVILTIMLRL